MKGLGPILISVLLAVTGQLLLKQETIKLGLVNLNFHNMILLAIQSFTRPLVILSIFCYGVSYLFWIIALMKVDLSYAYPLFSLSYVLILFFSWIFFKEHISLARLLGMVIIISGIYLISRS